MLGRLELTIDECLDAYVALSNDIFTKQKPRINILGKVQPRFSTAGLEREIKKVITRAKLDKNALLRNDNGRCKV